MSNLANIDNPTKDQEQEAFVQWLNVGYMFPLLSLLDRSLYLQYGGVFFIENR